MRIALVSPFDSPCGIATYSQNLVPELTKLAELKVFGEDYWNREENFKFRLIEGLMEWKPDVVLIAHEYGWWDPAYKLLTLVSYLKWKKIKVIGLLHSVYEHLDKSITESCFDYIIVHTEGAKKTLINKGIKAKIEVIPHGCAARDELLKPLWNHIGGDTVFSFGFSFKYKGFVENLDIIHELKKEFPDVQYVVCGSQTDNAKEEHDEVYESFMKRAEELDLLSNVCFNRGFFSEELLLAYIRTAKVCLLNYQCNPEHALFAASGISKMIIQTTTPLFVSEHGLFEDIGSLALRGNPVKEISKVFRGEIEDSSRRLDYLNKNSWNNSAKKFFDFIQKC